MNTNFINFGKTKKLAITEEKSPVIDEKPSLIELFRKFSDAANDPSFVTILFLTAIIVGLITVGIGVAAFAVLFLP